MCPNEEFLSAFLDNEIEHPWDRHLSAHLAGCARCREKLAALRSVSERLRREEAPGLEERQRLVRERILSSVAGRQADPAYAFAEERDGNQPFFRRQVLLPMPVLAGGLAALFVLVASLFFFVGKSGSELQQTRNELENLKTIHVYYSTQDQDRFPAVISGGTLKEDVVFELPGIDTFRVGQPEVIYIREQK